MVNVWGLWFAFCVPMMILSICCYFEGIEEGKKLRKRRVKKYERFTNI